MNLRCHAITRKGTPCGARAFSVRDGRPVCGRWEHEFRADLAPLTAESVAPYELKAVKVYLDFLGGKSMREIASAGRMRRGQVEVMIREAGR